MYLYIYTNTLEIGLGITTAESKPAVNIAPCCCGRTIAANSKITLFFLKSCRWQKYIPFAKFKANRLKTNIVLHNIRVDVINCLVGKGKKRSRGESARGFVGQNMTDCKSWRLFKWTHEVSQ